MPSPPPASPGKPRPRGSGCARCMVLPLVPGLDRPPARIRPLPDATAVRLVVVPDSAPPYDDERGAAGLDAARLDAAGLDAAGLDAAGLDAAGLDAAGLDAAGQPRRLALASAPRAMPRIPPARAAAVPAGQQPGPSPARGGQPAAVGWPGQFAQVLAETLAGSRPQGQIAPWTTDQARRRIRQLGPMLAVGVQPRVRRIVTSRPSAGVVEMTVIVGFGPRIRALAVRLERDGPHHASPGRAAKAARWVCTVIEAA